MDQALSIFNFEGSPTQTITIDGELWWVATDVCKNLDIKNVSQAVESLDEDEKGISIVYTLRGNQSLLCVNESGLYHLIFTSRKEQAQKFRRWVTTEVLPSIRKYGCYPPPLPYANSDRQPITAPQEKELVYHYVHHIWTHHQRACTANFLARGFVKRLSTHHAQQLLEELAHEGRIERFFTAHTPQRGKFRPVLQQRKLVG